MLVGMCNAADYNGPRPPKPDIPYLKHASSLIETEVVEAKEESGKKETTYVIPGPASTAKTPLAEPIFLMESEKISPDRLELYRLEVKGGRREITIGQKRKGRPLRVTVTRVADRLYRIEAGESLEDGEYSLSPADSNQAFCFEIY